MQTAFNSLNDDEHGPAGDDGCMNGEKSALQILNFIVIYWRVGTRVQQRGDGV